VSKFSRFNIKTLSLIFFARSGFFSLLIHTLDPSTPRTSVYSIRCTLPLSNESSSSSDSSSSASTQHNKMPKHVTPIIETQQMLANLQRKQNIIKINFDQIINTNILACLYNLSSHTISSYFAKTCIAPAIA